MENIENIGSFAQSNKETNKVKIDENNEKGIIKKNKYTLSEELVSAISHGIGTLLAITGMVLCIIKAASSGKAINVVSAVLYGSFMIILYLMSTLYHSFKPTCKAKKVFRVFDHCCIFLLIFGSYVPFALITLKGAIGWTIFGVVLGASVLGIVFNSISIEKFKKFSMICYLTTGWCIMFVVKPLITNLNRTGLYLLVTGGVIYSLGAIVYALGKKFKYMHSIWHFFVLAGTMMQFFTIYGYVL